MLLTKLTEGCLFSIIDYLYLRGDKACKHKTLFKRVK
jgi:hypothetical protein